MPGNSGSIRAGGAFVELFTDKSKLVKGLKDAGKDLKDWGKSVTAVGQTIFAAGLAMKGAMAASATIFAETGAGLVRMSEKTGIGVASLSALSYAADQTGTDMETLEKAIFQMDKRLGMAIIGDDEGAKGFRRLGLSIQDLANMSPEQRLMTISDALARIPDAAERAAAKAGVFGKMGGQLAPLLDHGSGAIKRLMGEADRLGITLSTSDALAAQDLDRAMRGAWATVKGTAVAIGSALAPAFTEFFTSARDSIGQVVVWIKENRGLIASASAVATGIIVTGAAVMALGYALSGVGMILGGMATAWVGFWGIITGAFTAVASTILFILSPIGLVVAAVVGLGTYVVYNSGLIGKAIDGLGSVFEELSADTKVAFDAIKAALSAGDFSAAANVLWAYLKLEWVRGTAFLTTKWAEMKSLLAEAWDVDLFASVRSAWIETIAFLEKAFVELQRFLAKSGTAQFIQKIVAKDLATAFAVLTGQDVGEVQKTLQEDLARRGGAVIGDQGARDQKESIDRDRDKQLADDKAATEERRRVFRLTHAPEIAHAGADRTQAEIDAQFALDKARADLHVAADAARIATTRPHKNLAKAADAGDEINVLGKGSQFGTYSAEAAFGLGGGIAGDISDTAKSTKQAAKDLEVMRGILEANPILAWGD
jgi:hypothetical protein